MKKWHRIQAYSNDDSGNNFEEMLSHCRVKGRAAPPSARMKLTTSTIATFSIGHRTLT